MANMSLQSSDATSEPAAIASPVTVVASAEPPVDNERCARILIADLGGTWRCVGKLGHAGHHSYKQWHGDGKACDRGMSGQCAQLAGHHGACVVLVSK